MGSIAPGFHELDWNLALGWSSAAGDRHKVQSSAKGDSHEANVGLHMCEVCKPLQGHPALVGEDGWGRELKTSSQQITAANSDPASAVYQASHSTPHIRAT